MNDTCPGCKRIYEYNFSQDTYHESVDLQREIAGRDVILHTCKVCHATIAVSVIDVGHGNISYIPDTREV